jgi:hypothetical protein
MDWDIDQSDDFLGEALVPLRVLEGLRRGQALDRWFKLTDDERARTRGNVAVTGSVRLELLVL